MKPDPDIPIVFRELAIVCSVLCRPISSIVPRVGVPSSGSNVAKSNRWPSTNTLPTMSPPPPTTGLLWQPEQEFVSGADTRLNCRGNTSGVDGSESGEPVPLDNGRPAPSCTVHIAVNSCSP